MERGEGESRNRKKWTLIPPDYQIPTHKNVANLLAVHHHDGIMHVVRGYHLMEFVVAHSDTR